VPAIFARFLRFGLFAFGGPVARSGVVLFGACLVVLLAWRSRWATPAVVAGTAIAGLLILGGLRYWGCSSGTCRSER
jgi:hypothetical protein